MRLVVNGEYRDAPSGMTLDKFMVFLGVERGRVACELNGRIVKRAEDAGITLRDGDVLEIVQIIGGG